MGEVIVHYGELELITNFQRPVALIPLQAGRLGQLRPPIASLALPGLHVALLPHPLRQEFYHLQLLKKCLSDTRQNRDRNGFTRSHLQFPLIQWKVARYKKEM